MATRPTGRPAETVGMATGTMTTTKQGLAMRGPVSGSGPGTVLRVAAIVVAALLLIWVGIGVTMALNVRTFGHAATLRVWPMASEARAAAAFERIVSTGTPRPQAAAGAYRQAAAALRRAPISVTAARTMGLARSLGGDTGSAVRLLNYAESLSRRDIQTELALIEMNVAKGDVAAVLRHYDHALRTHPRSADVLMPVLVQSSTDMAIARQLVLMLRARPSWFTAYVKTLFQYPIDPASFTFQMAQSRFRIDQAEERALLTEGIARLISRDQVARAYMLVPDARMPEQGLRNGDFEHQDLLPPFDWQLTQNPELGAEYMPADGGKGQMLHLIATGSQYGPVAEQLLLLAKGSYSLTGRIGQADTTDAGTVTILLGCHSTGNEIVRLAITLPVRTDRIGTRFAVPAACEAQRLQVMVSANNNLDAWLDDLVIRPLS